MTLAMQLGARIWKTSTRGVRLVMKLERTIDRISVNPQAGVESTMERKPRP